MNDGPGSTRNRESTRRTTIWLLACLLPALVMATWAVPAAGADDHPEAADGGSGVDQAGNDQPADDPVDMVFLRQSAAVAPGDTFEIVVQVTGVTAPIEGQPPLTDGDQAQPPGDDQNPTTGDDQGQPADGDQGQPEGTGQAHPEVRFNAVVYTVLESDVQLDDEPAQPVHRIDAMGAETQWISNQLVAVLSFAVRNGAQDQVAGTGDGNDNGDQAANRVALNLPDPGVYPVVIEVSVDGVVRGYLRTNLIRLAGDDETAPEPPVMTVVLSPSEDDNGASNTLRQALGDHPDAPATVLVGPAKLDQWERDPTEAGRWSQALADRPVMPRQNTGIEPSALAEIDQGDLYAHSLAELRNRVTDRGLVSPVDTVVTQRPLTVAGAELVAAQGATRVLSLNRDPVLVASTPSAVQGRLDAISVGAASPLMGKIGRDQGQPESLAWHRQLAAWRLQAAQGQPGVVLTNVGQPVAAGFWPFLFAANQAGVVELVSLDRFWASAGENSHENAAGNGAESAIPQWTPAGQPAISLEPLRAGLVELDLLLNQYRSSYVSGSPAPSDYQHEAVDAVGAIGAVDGSDTVNGSGTVHDLGHGEAEGDAQREVTHAVAVLDAINHRLADDIDQVSLPSDTTVNVAAHITDIPLTLENTADGARHARIRFRSDSVLVAEPDRVVTLEPGSNTLSFEAEVRTMGTSTVHVSVWTPDGTRQLATNRLTVRSTAVPGLGLAIGIGGMGVLAIWWVMHHRNRRRRAAIA